MGVPRQAGLLLVGFLTASPAQPTLPEVPLLNSELEDFDPFVSQRLQKAYQEFSRQPDDSGAAGRLGMVLQAAEQYELALPCYKRAHLLEPKSFRWVYYLGRLQEWLGSSETAASLQKSLQIDASYLPARLALADSLLGAGRWGEGADIYRAILKKHPESPFAHYGLGRIQSATGDLQAAAGSLSKACQLFPGFGSAHYALGVVYRDLGEPAEAQEQFSRFQRSREGTPALADPLMEDIEALRSGATYHHSRGIRLQGSDQFRQAASQFEQVLQFDSTFAPAHAALLSTYLALGELDKAQKHYLAAVKLKPDNYELHHNFGILLTLRGRPAEAQQAFRRVLEINPYYAESHNNLGFLLADQGLVREAIEHLQLAIESKPNFRLPHFKLGQILHTQGKYAEAVPHLLKTLANEDEETPFFLYLLADAYFRLGEHDKAMSYAQQSRRRAASLAQKEVLRQADNLLRQLKEAGQGS